LFQIKTSFMKQIKSKGIGGSFIFSGI